MLVLSSTVDHLVRPGRSQPVHKQKSGVVRITMHVSSLAIEIQNEKTAWIADFQDIKNESLNVLETPLNPNKSFFNLSLMSSLKSKAKHGKP